MGRYIRSSKSGVRSRGAAGDLTHRAPELAGKPIGGIDCHAEPVYLGRIYSAWHWLYKKLRP
jgi:hypothetical protein